MTRGAADQSKPVLAGKPVVLATVRGRAYGPEAPRAGWDHSTAYLVRILRDVFGADLTVVEREFTLVGVNPALDAFTDQAAEKHAVALDEAREAGKALGALSTAPRAALAGCRAKRRPRESGGALSWPAAGGSSRH